MKPSGLAGELVVAIEETDVTATILDRQFARTPYAVSFQAGAEELTLVMARDLGGRRGAACRRASRDRHVARGLAEPREHVEQEPDHTGGLQRQSGDPLRRPHLDRPDHSCGAERVPRTIFDESSKQYFYDQIAWFQENGNRSVLSLRFLSAGSFDFVPLLQGGLTKTQLSWKISDHHPLWLEFSV